MTHPRSLSLRNGYTLIEVLVVVVLLSLLAAFTIPIYQLIVSQAQLSNSVEEVSDFIRLAQQKTVTEQQIYGVTLTAGATTVPLFRYDSGTGTKTTQSTMTLPSTILIQEVNFAGESDIRFVPSGAPSVSGNVVLRDTPRGRNRRIEIRPSGNILTNTGEF